MRQTAGERQIPKPRTLSRRVSWFLLAFGIWSVFLWTTFVKNLWKDSSGLAFDDAGDPTGYFWVHLLLAITSFLLGTAIGVLGWRGLRALGALPGRRGGAGGTTGTGGTRVTSAEPVDSTEDPSTTDLRSEDGPRAAGVGTTR